MKFKILSIFPDSFEQATNYSLLKKAKDKGLIQLESYNIRDWAKDKTVHKQVDDRPYGGGPGMILMVEPIYRALNELKTPNSSVIIFSPKGKVYNQIIAENLAIEKKDIILIAPHYEGFDERILHFIDYELSFGNYILTGGEIPALALIDSVSRLIPGVLGNEKSSQLESFSKLKSGFRNTEHAQYTRPEVFTTEEGVSLAVPEVLIGGNHKKIEEWRDGNTLISPLQ